MIHSWFNVRHLTKEGVVEIVGSLLAQHPSLGEIKNIDNFIEQFFSIKLKSYYRRLQSDEVKAIIKLLEENKQS